MKKKALRNLNRMLEKDFEKIEKEKEEFAKKHHLHLFRGGKCIFCGKSFEQAKRENRRIDVEWEGIKISAYEGCKNRNKNLS